MCKNYKNNVLSATFLDLTLYWINLIITAIFTRVAGLHGKKSKFEKKEVFTSTRTYLTKIVVRLKT